MQKSQFSIDTATKNKLDKYKAIKKEEIIKALDKDRRFVSNTDVIEYLLMQVKQ